MIEIRAPSRLHFGLFAFGCTGARQFGGVGLMVGRPDLAIRVEPADVFHAEGPMADRALWFANRFAEGCAEAGADEAIRGARIQILRAPRPHTGLGAGTQLAMAVARALALLIDRRDWGAPQLAGLVERGERSAIGAHGFCKGGLLVEGGKIDPSRLSPLIVHRPFPADWRIVLVCPRHLQGLAGDRERQAFATMPTISDEATSRMCRLVLMGLLPAVTECDVAAFGASLYELQQVAGSCFRESQGGLYAGPVLEQIVRFVRDRGVPGVGQSSWGPTLYALCGDEDRALQLAGHIQRRFNLDGNEVVVTEADNQGALVRELDRSVRSAGATRDQ